MNSNSLVPVPAPLTTSARISSGCSSAVSVATAAPMHRPVLKEMLKTFDHVDPD
ncbi:hypothetical protein [Streptomyces sp. AC550_RSS872]|uniref:hypothetical protein n=1 Tax=Streptomyces sp. AC550_RSS872 TaxID=2823689 RepID=UPI001C26F250|nr:hypothetical protein [Streptomyces sp. AC550_RSS872]